MNKISFSTTLLICFFIPLTTGLVSALETADVSIVRKVGASDKKSLDRELARYTVEIATGKTDRERGLSGRISLSEKHGMLFPLSDGFATSFWMSGMLFPIDILFFSREGVLIQILPDLPVCTDCPLYPVPARASLALEVNAGHTRRFGYRAGDILIIRKSAEHNSSGEFKGN